MAIEAIALVIMLNGWIDGGPGARGNVIDHIAGFSSMEKCETAGQTVRKAGINPGVIKTVCVSGSAVAPEPGNALVVIVNGWNENGSGAEGNAVHHIRFVTTPNCEAAGKKIRDGSANKEIMRTVCVDL